MRKRVLGPSSSPRHSSDASEWLNLTELAEVEVTSEADGYPVEAAFNFGLGAGWRAAASGEQRIRLILDEPQSFRRMRLEFHEHEIARTQEFAVRWSGGADEPLVQIVRQQWNFSPEGSTIESEDYTFDLKGVVILELTIDPDRGAGKAYASLADWRLA